MCYNELLGAKAMKYFVRMYIRVEHEGVPYGGYIGYEVENKSFIDKFSRNVLDTLKPGVKFIENTADLILTKDNRFKCFLKQGSKSLYFDGYLTDLKQIVSQSVKVWHV